jgi:SAM-dependent methyltransferase
MHPSVLSWFRTTVAREDIAGRRVLEVGSFNVNGSVRPILTGLQPAEYHGVDASAGDGVDQVLDCTALVDEFGAGSWDVVVSTEMLEHVEDWRACVRNLVQVLAPGGLLLVTTRSPGFPYHPFPGDYWRYTRVAVGRIVSNARLDAVEICDDPEAPGVFVKARKPDGWRPPRGNPWAGVEVQPVQRRQGTVMPEDKDTAKAESVDKPRDDRMIAALLRERAGYESLGKSDRVALVDEQLKQYGHNAEDGKAAARKLPPQGRSSKPQQTGD